MTRSSDRLRGIRADVFAVVGARQNSRVDYPGTVDVSDVGFLVLAFFYLHANHTNGKRKGGPQQK